jgi:hypothetical protein
VSCWIVLAARLLLRWLLSALIVLTLLLLLLPLEYPFKRRALSWDTMFSLQAECLDVTCFMAATCDALVLVGVQNGTQNGTQKGAWSAKSETQHQKKVRSV